MNTLLDQQPLEDSAVLLLRGRKPPRVLEFEPPEEPRRTFSTLLAITLGIVMMVSLFSATVLMLRIW
jgi:hypothetical protein